MGLLPSVPFLNFGLHSTVSLIRVTHLLQGVGDG